MSYKVIPPPRLFLPRVCNPPFPESFAFAFFYTGGLKLVSANAVIAGRAGRVSCVSGGQGSNFVSAGGPEPRGKMKIAQTLRSWSFELIYTMSVALTSWFKFSRNETSAPWVSLPVNTACRARAQ